MSAVRYVLISKFCELTGWGRDAVDKFISKGQWAEGLHYRRVNGRILVDLRGFEEWVEKGGM